MSAPPQETREPAETTGPRDNASAIQDSEQERLAREVEIAVTGYKLKLRGRRRFTDFAALAPAIVRRACRAALDEQAAA